MLLSKGCHVQPTTTAHGDTPLHLAATDGRIQLGKLLLDYGHPMQVTNNAGETPADQAQKFGQVDFYHWATKQGGGGGGQDLNTKPGQVGTRQEHELKVQKLIDRIISEPERALNNIRSGYYDVHSQDMQGHTALHHASAAGNLSTVQDLIDFGCYISPVTLSGQTPADLARERGHNHVYNFLSEKVRQSTHMDWSKSCQNYYNLLESITIAGRSENAITERTDLEVQEDMFRDIKNMSDLISQGTPLSPPGSMPTELILSASNSNSPRILEFLLCTGAPLLGIQGRQSALEMTWLKPIVTTKEAVLITRQVEMNLCHELQMISREEKADSLLIEGINSLLEQLGADRHLKNELQKLIPGQEKMIHQSVKDSGYTCLYSILHFSNFPEKIRELHDLSSKFSKVKPWRASWRISNQSYGANVHLLVRSCHHGLTNVSWWLWRSGVNTSMADDHDQLPLLAAISNQHWDTVKYLIGFMNCNPFVNSPREVAPFKLIQQRQSQLSQEILQKMVMVEFNCLFDMVMGETRDPVKNLKRKKMCLLLAYIYVI
ncbi:unnamed protein product, partial [Meganyctiphanes norvegica]